MPAFTALAIGGGLSSLGSLGSRHDAARQQVKARHDTLAMYLRAMQQQRSGMNKAQKGYEGVVTDLNKNFGLARADLSTQGNSARRGVMTNQAQAGAQATQSLTSRGLGSTSVLDAAKSGISTSTSRQLADIDERLGAMFASLRTQQAGAVAGAQSNLASFLGSRAQGDFANRIGYADLYLNSQVQKPDPWAAIGAGINAGAGIYGMGQYLSGGGGLNQYPVGYSNSKVK